ncbi:succinate--CoA ligase subunit alpha [Xanthobacter tagetidis]|uniref:Succinate--CoA ligase subunit alpha n=1 Tax=Xanthobacter tagetidis TaxID=60216 RepID=A0A3L7AIV5_9HYPH|nr:succinate--CoA ligase subunit alpha [Xanthobacter tagetidis]MBB6306966.1 succinyl-CoA synthetase alpha subunit [Xanthobacter tagetidis]RLP79974.1 succinate--CoA ligase subunit alpha [Xanthobacter tagetidis]
MISDLFAIDRSTPVIIQGITGRMGRRHAALMRAYGTRIVGGTSARAGSIDEMPVPVFATCGEAVAATGARASVVMVPPEDVLDAASEAIAAGIGVVVTIAEGVPVHDALKLKAIADENDAVWIGPSTPGMARPGKAKLGFLPDISLHPGDWAMLTKSGTLSYEVGYRLAARGLGQSIWIGVGGEVVKGVRFADLVAPLAADPATRGILLVGEVGGTEEEEFADALIRQSFPKPVLALLAGRESKQGVAMGHAGALTFGAAGTLQSKRKHLEAAGAEVFFSLEALAAHAVELSSSSDQDTSEEWVHG